MGLSEDHVKGALRLSWCHMTSKVEKHGADFESLDVDNR
jgi:hypothetical protein